MLTLLLLLGVPLWILLTLGGVLLAHRRWVRRRPGAFGCRLRRIESEGRGISGRWRAGHGLWVRDVLSWRANLNLFRDSLFAVDSVDLSAVHPVRAWEVKMLAQDVVAVPLRTADGSTIELAVRAEDEVLALGPFAAGRNAARQEEPAANAL